jgi:hypothetical protein
MSWESTATSRFSRLPRAPQLSPFSRKSFSILGSLSTHKTQLLSLRIFSAIPLTTPGLDPGTPIALAAGKSASPRRCVSSAARASHRQRRRRPPQVRPSPARASPTSINCGVRTSRVTAGYPYFLKLVCLTPDTASSFSVASATVTNKDAYTGLIFARAHPISLCLTAVRAISYRSKVRYVYARMASESDITAFACKVKVHSTIVSSVPASK